MTGSDNLLFTANSSLDISSLRLQRQQDKQRQREAEIQDLEEKRSRLELNPYWKDGGTGLPPPEAKPRQQTSLGGDGGVSWWKKALQRCQELAEIEGRSIEEIAAERYGVSF